MRRLLIALLSTLGVLACASAGALAYKLIGAEATDGTYCSGSLLDCDDTGPFVRWFQPVVPFWVNDGAASDATGSTISQAQIITAAQASYQSWQDVPTSFLKFSYQGETTARLAADGVNTLLVYNAALDSGTCAGYMGSAGGTLAITVLTEDLPTGEIIDADIIMDSADQWATGTACTVYDFQSVLTHEYGHSVGLHHSDLGGGVTVRPTMYAYYFCDAGVASGRSLEPDDEAALACLYPESPALILLDETGSMSVGNRMTDAQGAANDFIADFGDNTMAVASFAESAGCVPPRDGYNLRENWTTLLAPLQAAVNATSPCGATPMWESICCGIGKSTEQDPANLLVLTDTAENVSGGLCSAECPAGYCGCVTVNDALTTAAGTDVSVYVIDVTLYSSAFAGSDAPEEEPVGRCSNTGDRCFRDEDCPKDGICEFPPDCNQQFPSPDGQQLNALAEATGGIYCAAYGPQELKDARLAIEKHMMDKGKAKQNPATCVPELGLQLADTIQRYDLSGNPDSPLLDQGVLVQGVITVRPGNFDEFVTYVEDCSGGVKVLDRTPPGVDVGTEVLVEGRVGVDQGGEILIEPAEIQPRGPGKEPTPAIVDPQVAQDFEQIGSLMVVRGYAESDVSSGRFELVSDLFAPNPSRVTVYLHPKTGIDPRIIVAKRAYEITGILSRRDRRNELMPRNGSDVVETFASNPVSLPGEVRKLEARYNRQLRQIDVKYDPACASSNHTILYGPLGAVSSYNYTGAVCSLGTSGQASFNPVGLNNAFFVVVGENGIEEGSYGRRSSGAERPEDLGTPGCDRPQSLGASCP